MCAAFTYSRIVFKSKPKKLSAGGPNRKLLRISEYSRIDAHITTHISLTIKFNGNREFFINTSFNKTANG